jgi:hypothetical protein
MRVEPKYTFGGGGLFGVEVAEIIQRVVVRSTPDVKKCSQDRLRVLNRVLC